MVSCLMRRQSCKCLGNGCSDLNKSRSKATGRRVMCAWSTYPSGTYIHMVANLNSLWTLSKIILSRERLASMPTSLTISCTSMLSKPNTQLFPNHSAWRQSPKFHIACSLSSCRPIFLLMKIMPMSTSSSTFTFTRTRSSAVNASPVVTEFLFALTGALRFVSASQVWTTCWIASEACRCDCGQFSPSSKRRWL